MNDAIFRIDGAELARRRQVFAELWAGGDPVTRIVASYPLERRITDITFSSGLTITDPRAILSLAPALLAQADGFDNIPTLRPAFWLPDSGCGVHLLPVLLGASVRQVGEGYANFATWVEPLRDIGEMSSLRMPECEAISWCQAWQAAVAAFATDWQRHFSIELPGMSPVDAAADLLGSTAFYLACHTDPEALRQLLDLCADAVVTVTRWMRAQCRHWCGPLGMPVLYMSDLVTEFLSPDHWEAFVIPCYRRIAEGVGEIVVAVPSPHPRVLRAMAGVPGYRGGSMHRDQPITAIMECLGKPGVYFLPSHPYNPGFDRPTVCDGQYYNPRVAHPTERYQDIYTQLAGRVPLLVLLDRSRRVDAMRDRQLLSAR